MKIKIKKAINKAYLKLKDISPNIKKSFSENIKIKGKGSTFDSVDIITFFSFLETELLNSKVKNPSFLDKEFFFKYEDISIFDIIKLIIKKNGNKN